jgi:hypothetical protein
MEYKFWNGRNTSSWLRGVQRLPTSIQRGVGHLYTKWLVKTGRVHERTRSNYGVLKMLDKSAVKDLFYGGVLEILQNKKYYYNSSVGVEYNHFTDDGKEAMDEYLKYMVMLMLKAEQESLNKRAKELVIKGLKGESI